MIAAALLPGLLLAVVPAARAEDEVLTLPAVDAAGPPPTPHARVLALVPPVASADQLSAGVDAGLARDLLVWEDEQGGTIRGVGRAGRLDLRGAWAGGPARLGLTLPVHLVTGGELSDGRDAVVAGDARVEGGLELLGAAGAGGPVGLGLLGGLELPLGAASHGLGETGLGGDVGLLIDLSAGPLWVGGRGGAVLRPRATARDVVFDEAVVVAGGATVALPTATTLGAEAWSERPLGAAASPAAAPAEVRGVVGQQLGALTLRATGGVGLGAGIGAPAWRAGVGVSWGVDAAAVQAGTAPPEAPAEAPAGGGA